MTPLAQRTAIAKAVSWKQQEQFEDSFSKPTIKVSRGLMWTHPELPVPVRVLPDYLSDLNAMHSAWEQCIAPHNELRSKWRYWLAVITKRDEHKLPYKRSVSCAPCSIRAEAFLRTLSLWEENPPS